MAHYALPFHDSSGGLKRTGIFFEDAQSLLTANKAVRYECFNNTTNHQNNNSNVMIGIMITVVVVIILVIVTFMYNT